VLTQTSNGKDLGFEASMTKIMWSETFRRVSDAYERVIGTGFQVPDPRPGLAVEELATMAMWSRSCTIWGGSQQVQRTVVAERVLGLPR
jgi:alkylation response protein AidB-like acyl-CoA dehydrogenase